MIEDAQILEFARRWLPFGGGEPIDLMVEFGMTPTRYAARLAKILDGPAAVQLDPQLRGDLHRFVHTLPERSSRRSGNECVRTTTARRSAGPSPRGRR